MKTRAKMPAPVRSLIALAFWVGIWWIISLIVDREVLIPSPSAVVKRLFELVQTADFHLSVLMSVLRITAGFVIAVAAGIVTGAVSAKFGAADALISPLMSVIKATPVASFIILALVLMNKEIIPGFAAALMVIPVIHGNVKEGILSADPQLLEMARVFRFTKKQKLKRIYIPAVSPYLSAGAKTCLGLAWKAGVAAEVICLASNSIGNKLYSAKVYLETADMFAWTITVIIMSMIIEKLLSALITLWQRKRKNDKDNRSEKAV